MPLSISTHFYLYIWLNLFLSLSLFLSVSIFLTPPLSISLYLILSLTRFYLSISVSLLISITFFYFYISFSFYIFQIPVFISISHLMHFYLFLFLLSAIYPLSISSSLFHCLPLSTSSFFLLILTNFVASKYEDNPLQRKFLFRDKFSPLQICFLFWRETKSHFEMGARSVWPDFAKFATSRSLWQF